MDAPLVETKDLTRTFGDFTAVDHVSLRVERGEIFGFLGPNGAGKTTTINILCTLLKPTSGQARVCGLDVVRQQSQVRQRIGLVFQDPSLDDRLTAWDNLLFHAYVYNVPRNERKPRMESILRMVELWERRNNQVKTFSGGMKRRLEIARGLLHHPRLLFLDEPTLGLDPQSRAHIWQYLHQLRKEEDITIFLTTHYMEEAENAHRIAIIDHGRIVALDTPGELKKKVSADIVTIKTSDDKKASEEIETRFGIHANGAAQASAPGSANEGISLEVPNGHEFVPRLVSGLSTPVISVSVRRPTLEDVFLKLTGRELRDSDLTGKDIMREHMRMFSRPGGRRHG
ncbi:MAG: ATP-binding cassette domain-containing protein [Chloroflexi bacterium]|nr:ATP-binding cassette domain-containing protein [Chloroflexota bacterium]